MPPESAPRSVVVNDAEQVKLLSDPKYRALLLHFMRCPGSVGAAAATLDLSVQRTFNFVQRLERNGLLEVCAVRARAGKSVKTYRATAEDYFLPFALTHAAGYAHLLEQELRPLQRSLLESLERALAHRDPFGWGTRLFRDSEGGVHTLFTPRDDWQGFECLNDLLADDAPAIAHFWGVVTFTPDQAKTLQRELVALWIKHYLEARANPPGVTLEGFVVSLGMAPVQPRRA
jgi:molybdenum-dependent DNA-binding transcriptional regulator ModE